MKASDELLLLMAQERAAAPPPEGVDAAWTALKEAVAAGAAPLVLATTPLRMASTWAVMKLAIAPFVVGAVVGTGAAIVTAASQPAVSVVASSAPEVTQPPPPNRAEGPTGVPSASVGLSLPPPAEPAASPRVAPAASLEAELALIQRAKAALDEGRSDDAQAWLEEHQRAFPRGILASEREGLRILTACRSGNVDAVRVRARQFVRGGSVLADHIQRACGLGENDTTSDRRNEKPPPSSRTEEETPND
jgi:hypothetical protein